MNIIIHKVESRKKQFTSKWNTFYRISIVVGKKNNENDILHFLLLLSSFREKTIINPRVSPQLTITRPLNIKRTTCAFPRNINILFNV